MFAPLLPFATVPSAKVKSMISTLVDLLRRFTPEERLPEVARELQLLSPSTQMSNSNGVAGIS